MSPELMGLRESFDKNIEITVQTDIWFQNIKLLSILNQRKLI